MRVCMILEGCYPYVFGGVSSWTHHYIEAMPDTEFSLWTIGASEGQKGKFKFTLPEKYGYYKCGDFAFKIENKLLKINKYFVKNGIFYKIDRNGVINPDEVEKITVFSGSWFDPEESVGQNLTYGIQNTETDFLNYFSHNWAKYNIKQYETIQNYKSISEFMDSYNNQSTLEEIYSSYCSKYKTDDVFFQVDIKDFRISLIFGKDAIFKNNSLYLF